MKSFCVAHMSDLHICGNRDHSHTKTVRDKLIEDITDTLLHHNLKLDAIVISGDTLNRGGSPEAIREACDYINDLRAKLALSVNQIMIVPGNHDAARKNTFSSLISNMRKEDLNDEEESECIWGALKQRFARYYELIPNSGGAEVVFGASCQDITTDAGVCRFFAL